MSKQPESTFQIDSDEFRKESSPAPDGLQRLTRTAVLVGILTVLAGWAVGFYVHTSSRGAVAKIVYENNLSLAQAFAVYAEILGKPVESSRVLAAIQEMWDHTTRQPGSYMCIVGSDGSALLHTARPEQVGEQMGGDRLLAEREGGPKNIEELLKARRDWVGLCPAAENQQLVGAFAYCSSLDALISIYVPLDTIDARISPAMLPGVLGMAVVTFVLLPLALVLLYRASRLNQRELLQVNRAMQEEITERLMTENALRESQDRFRAVSESAVDGIVVADREGNITSWNPGAQAMFGYAEEEILGYPVARLMPAQYREDHQRGLERYNSNGESKVIGNTIEHRGLRKDGTEFPLEYSLATWKTGDETFFGAIVRDISDRKEAEIETERLAGFPRENPNPVLACGADGKLTYANPAAKQLAQKREVEIDPALLPANHRELVSKSLEGGQSIWGVELNLWGRVYSWTYNPVPSLETVHLYGRDITETKHAQEQIRDSLKEKEVLLQEVYHRVKNNLQIVSSLLNQQASALPDEHVRKVLFEMHNRVRSMALIHQELYQSADLTHIGFADYIRNLTATLFQSYEGIEEKVALRLEIEDIALGLETAIPCGLIINELVTNAFKYAFPDGKAGEVCVDLHNGEERTYILKVRDNGVGLPREVDFDHPTTLGLRLVQDLTYQLGGRIQIHRNGGTEFELTFSDGDDETAS